MKKVLLSLVLALMMNNNIEAYTVLGYGGEGCGQVIANEGDFLYKREMTSWLQGFVSGINHENSMDKTRDNESMYYDVLRRCKERPLSKMAEMAYFMYLDLPNNP